MSSWELYLVTLQFDETCQTVWLWALRMWYREYWSHFGRNGEVTGLCTWNLWFPWYAHFTIIIYVLYKWNRAIIPGRFPDTKQTWFIFQCTTAPLVPPASWTDTTWDGYQIISQYLDQNSHYLTMPRLIFYHKKSLKLSEPPLTHISWRAQQVVIPIYWGSRCQTGWWYRDPTAGIAGSDNISRQGFFWVSLIIVWDTPSVDSPCRSLW